VRTGKDISPDLLEAIRDKGLDTLEGAFGYTEGEELSKPGLGHRRRIRFSLTDRSGKGHTLYLKLYDRERTSGRLRRWWTYGGETSPADVEFDNIEALRSAALPTMQAVVCDRGGARSHLIVTSVPGKKLEACMKGFVEAHSGSPQIIEAFTLDLARLVRKFHSLGYVHRALYFSHVFLDESDGKVQLHLIDLARAFVPRWRRKRWQIKDLAQLKYSAPSEVWVSSCWEKFLREYLDCDERWKNWWWNWRIDLKVAMMRIRRGRKARDTGR
jgi:hypothetical protein